MYNCVNLVPLLISSYLNKKLVEIIHTKVF